MSDDILKFADALREHPQKVSKQVRGIMAKHLDRGAATARSQAKATFTGQGPTDTRSADTIRARMSATVGSRGGGRQVGYLLADGAGIFHLERGGRHTPPNPVLRRAAEGALQAMGPEVLQIMVKVRP